jgi:hypothetical protein
MIKTLTLSSLALGLFVSAAAAQPVRPAAGAYDPQTEQTYGGVVAMVISVAGPDGTTGVHLDLKTAAGAILKVHLGPAMFIGMNNASFFADDLVLVKGAPVNHDGQVAIWAREITKGARTLTLRDLDGTPRWPFATAADPDGCGVSHDPVRY